MHAHTRIHTHACFLPLCSLTSTQYARQRGPLAPHRPRKGPPRGRTCLDRSFWSSCAERAAAVCRGARTASSATSATAFAPTHGLLNKL